MKKIIFIIFLTLFIWYCIFFSKEMAFGVATGLTLWYKNVVPTLLPFCILSYIIIHSNLYHSLFLKLRLFSEPELLYPAVFGFVCGFPIGAKLMADLYESNHIGKKRFTLYTAAFNNFGPAFIMNYIGISQLQNIISAQELFISIYLPSILLFLVLFVTEKRHGAVQAKQHKKPASRSFLNFKTIDTGIINGFETMLRIAGYIVLFSILARAAMLFLGQYDMFLSLLTGLMEVTTGVNLLANTSSSLSVKYCMICGTVSFGGLCGLFQTKSIMKNCPFHILQYACVKLLCAFSSVIIAFLLTIT